MFNPIGVERILISFLLNTPVALVAIEKLDQSVVFPSTFRFWQNKRAPKKSNLSIHVCLGKAMGAAHGKKVMESFPYDPDWGRTICVFGQENKKSFLFFLKDLDSIIYIIPIKSPVSQSLFFQNQTIALEF